MQYQVRYAAKPDGVPKLLWLGLSLFLLVLGLSGALAEGVDGTISEGEYQATVYVAGGDFQISWRHEGAQYHFGLVARTVGWLAIGFDPEDAMQGADMIVGWVDDQGAAYVLDCYSTGAFGPHPPDTELGGTADILAFAGTQDSEMTVVEFSRRAAVDDRFDKPVPSDGEVQVVWAFANGDDFDEKHDTSGIVVLNMQSGSARGAAMSPRRILLPIHAISLSTAFLLLLFGMLVARYLKAKRWWLKVHRLNGLLSPLLGLIGVGIGFWMVSTGSGRHFRVPHSIVAAATIVLLAATPLVGYLMLHKRVGAKKTLRVLHRWVGRLALTAMLATLFLGLFQAGIL